MSASRAVVLAYSPTLRAWLAWLPAGIRVVRNGLALAGLDRTRQYRGTFRKAGQGTRAA